MHEIKCREKVKGYRNQTKMEALEVRAAIKEWWFSGITRLCAPIKISAWPKRNRQLH